MEKRSAEDALRSCIELIAGMTGQPEDRVERWLDLYFKIRMMSEEPPSGRELPPKEEKPKGKPQEEPAQKKARMTQHKREVLQKLREARESGVSLQAIATASNLSIGNVISFLNGQVMTTAQYRALERGLAKLEEPKAAEAPAAE